MLNHGSVLAVDDSRDEIIGPTEANLSALRGWFLEQSGELHPSIRFESPSTGVHGAHLSLSPNPAVIPPETDLLHVPFACTLSPLSIPQIAPFWPLAFLDTFATEPQVLGRFAIMEAWLQQSNSFWWPYLRTVPQPITKPGLDAFDTPLYWNDEDRSWLRNSRLEKATLDRERLWKTEFEKAMQALTHADIPEPDQQRWMAVQRKMWKVYDW